MAMPIADIVIYIFLAAAAALSYIVKKLTLPGAITGAIVGSLIYKGAGYTGIAMLALFFIAGSWATGWQRGKRSRLIITDDHHKTGRTAAQVLANGGVAALLGAFAWYMPVHAHLMQLMLAGSLAAATADTLSSELGTIYGTRFYNVLTFQKDVCGLDGVVSLEGTLIEVAGAALIATVYSIGFGWGMEFWMIIFAGFTGNLADSVLGALLERKQFIGNNLVNFLNTLTGALICFLLRS